MESNCKCGCLGRPICSPFRCGKLDAAATTSNLQVQPAPMMHHDKLCLSGLYIFSKKEGIMLTMI